MAFCVARYLEKGVTTESAVPAAWVKDGRLFWSDSVNAKQDGKRCKPLDESWPSYKLLKVVFTSDDYDMCEQYVNRATTADESEVDQSQNQRSVKETSRRAESFSKGRSVPLPLPPTTSSRKSLLNLLRDRDQDDSLSPPPVAKSQRRHSPSPLQNHCSPIMSPQYSPLRRSPRTSLNLSRTSAASSSSSKPEEVRSKTTKSGYNRSKYPMEEGEFQRKVMLQLAEIKLLLSERPAAVDEEPEPIPRCDSIEELDLLEREVRADGDMFKALVKQLAKVGGKNVPLATKNILLTLTTDEVLQQFSYAGMKVKRGFKDLRLCDAVADAVVKCCRTTKSEAQLVIARVIKHAPDRAKRPQKK